MKKIGKEIWLSDRECEFKEGIPRECLAALSNNSIFIPPTEKDRSIRRRRLITEWGKHNKIDPFSHKGFIPREFCEEVRARVEDHRWPKNNFIDNSPFASVMAYISLAVHSMKSGTLGTVILRDFRDGPASKQEISEEWKRYQQANAKDHNEAITPHLRRAQACPSARRRPRADHL